MIFPQTSNIIITRHTTHIICIFSKLVALSLPILYTWDQGLDGGSKGFDRGLIAALNGLDAYSCQYWVLEYAALAARQSRSTIESATDSAQYPLEFEADSDDCFKALLKKHNNT